MSSGLPSCKEARRWRGLMSNVRTPWWLWPSLLSLDAPLVALAWLYMFASAWQVNFLPWPSYAVLGLAVWMVYVVDRLLDGRLSMADDPLLGRQHEFHARHRNKFKLGLLVALALELWLLVHEVTGAIFSPYGMLGFNYLTPGLGLVVVFFVLVVNSSGSREIPFFRNFVAGAAFGYGTAMMAHIYVPSQEVFSLLVSREMIGFSVLCAVNITAIHLWERSRLSVDPDEKAAMEGFLTILLTVVAASSVVFAYLDNPNLFSGGLDGGSYRARPFFYAILISCSLLLAINRSRRRFSLAALRTMADFAMIVPLPLFLILSRD
ncbi:hypothetical protein HNR46_002854 [Haloferula luteola]|uniref:Prenyltransferase n=1 Tax=Haloferula luteola TaxID=595692 RepID=A0A840V6F1_9BACT|nr:hypothetical protein [Haloferula luteola]MBB5352606.1 hypothetical protein [Haloferula luteola]